MKFLLNILYLSILTATFLFQCSCSKDLGNYDYVDINKVFISDVDTFYTVKQGSILSITPKIASSEAKDDSQYSYTWLKNGVVGKLSDGPKTVDSVKNLNVSIKDGLGVYNYTLRVTDLKTNIFEEKNFKVFVTQETYEGWLVLSDIGNDKSRLDMVSYHLQGNKYVEYEDILKKMNSKLRLTGSPNFVSYFNIYSQYTPTTSQEGDKSLILIGTNQIAKYVGVDTLNYSELYDFSVLTESGDNIAVGQHAKIYDNGSPQNYGQDVILLWADGNVYVLAYLRNFFGGINRNMSTDYRLFNASPYISFSGSQAVLFDQDNSEFVWYKGSSESYCSNLETQETLFKNIINKDLLFMKYVNYNGGETFAILKDKDGDKIYLARFNFATQNYFQEIKAPQLLQASCYEVNDDQGYIFYSVGGRLYQYDFEKGTNNEVADYGNRKISLIKFQFISTETDKTNRYADLRRKLVVCTYDEADLEKSGRMDLYTIPARSSELISISNSYSGFGKVKSITYRSR